MERRASSIPPNPFWSDRTKQSFQLEAARPMELPKVPSEGEDTSREGSVMSAKPVEDGTRGRGVSRNEQRNESRERRFEESKYKTPPSEREGVTGGGGRQSEGRMKTGKGRGEKREREEPLELQRELEKEMVMLLRDQNAKLMAEVEELKARNAQTQASDQPWSAVSPTEASQPEPPQTPRPKAQHRSQVHARRDKGP